MLWEVRVLEYSFRRIEVRRRREGFEAAEDYREIVRAQAAEGWEFVQAIAFERHVDPHLDLVFQRKGESQ